MLSAATWVRIRCRWKRGTTIICENSAVRIASTARHCMRSDRDVGGAELQPDHQALAAHLVEELVPLDQRLECLDERVAGAAGPIDDVLVVERGQAWPGRRPWPVDCVLKVEEWTTARSIELYTLSNTAAELIMAPTGHEAAGQRLGDGDDVGLETPVLVGEELARPPHAGLHLVDGQQRLVLAAQLLGRRPELVGRQVDALALDGLDDEGGHVPAAGAPGPGRRCRRTGCRCSRRAGA